MVRLKEEGNLIRIDDRLERVAAAIGAFPGAVAAFLFGSYGTPHQTPLSDVDIAVLFRQDAVPDPEQELRLGAAAAAAAGEDDINIVVLNKAPVTLCHEILATARELFVKDAVALADFREVILDVHGDMGYDLSLFLKEHRQALVEMYTLEH